MAIRISKDIYAKACDCDCGGEVDAFRDRGGQPLVCLLHAMRRDWSQSHRLG